MRRPQRTLRRRLRLRRDDGAVNEIIGFILMFAVSSVVLVISTQAYLQSQENTDHLLRGVELKNVATRVATHVTQAGLVSGEFPNATYTKLMRVSPTANGEPYRVTVTGSDVTAESTVSSLSATVTTYNLGSIEYLTVDGQDSAERQWFNVTYSYRWDATATDGPVRDDSAGVYNHKLIYFKQE